MATALSLTGKLSLQPTLQSPQRLADRSIIDAFNATKHTEPSYQFGSATRSGFVESEPTPGAGTYTIKTTLLGKVPDSKISSAPQYSLRSREKFGDPMLRALDPNTGRQPGPGWYTPQQVNPNEDKAPIHSFPKGSFPEDKPRLSPGPGAYALPGAVGRQVLSTKHNAHPMGFGNGARPQLLGNAVHDVGPGEYGAGAGSCKAQVDSRKRTSSFVKFGKGQRSQESSAAAKDDADARPGPGTYRLPSGICGGGSAHPFRSAPKASLAGREKFGSPF
ncbi:hypothetical protein M885DRAFT_528242 [Pelagophyceae sp. CCMP2097]|nr:hypothetical protein M885DRAFT_528242 [Pelagophyceae sp. CCMP2097]